MVQEYSFCVEDISVKQDTGEISGVRLDILVNGQTFILKYIFLFIIVAVYQPQL